MIKSKGGENILEEIVRLAYALIEVSGVAVAEVVVGKS